MLSGCKVTSLAPLLASARQDWNTPPVVLDLVRQFNGGQIGLDPCSNAQSLVGAATEWTEAEDGLSHEWTRRGLVYVNPPYGKEIRKWVEKCCLESVAGAEVVALVPARPDTKWWHWAMQWVRAVAFWRGRLTFLGAPAAAPFPSALLYWGGHSGRFVATFRERAWTVLV